MVVLPWGLLVRMEPSALLGTVRLQENVLAIAPPTASVQLGRPAPLQEGPPHRGSRSNVANEARHGFLRRYGHGIGVSLLLYI